MIPAGTCRTAGQLGNLTASVNERFDDLAPRRVGKRGETALSSFSEYLNHTVTINRSEHLVKPCFWDLQLVQAFRGQMRDVAPGVEQQRPSAKRK